MNILALDTALNACSVAVTAAGSVLARRSEPMMREHQERLAPMVQAVMAEAGMAFSRLDRIAATVGPGSFTGLRVGLAFAKGLRLALGVPCVGVGSLEALARSAPPADAVTAAVIDARREQVYLQGFDAAGALFAPVCLGAEDAAREIERAAAGRPVRLVGSGGGLIGARLADARVLDILWADPEAVADIAAASDAPATPIYLRAPDAKLPA